MSETVNAKRPLYGPHPTRTTNHTRMRVLGVGSHTDNRIDSYQRRRPQRTAHVVVSVVTATGKRPVPIPNPEAKPDSADGTAPARVRESRTPPSTHHTAGPEPPRAAPGQSLMLSYQQDAQHHPTTPRTPVSETERYPDRTDSGMRNGAPLSL